MKTKKRWKCEFVNDSTSKPPERAIRIICFSDTHSRHNKIPKDWFQPADIALFAGDFTQGGSLKDTISFKTFYKSLPYKYKVLIAGNHEVTFDIENRRDIIGHYLKREQKDYLNLINEYEKQTGEKVMPEEFKLYNDNAVNFIKKQITEDNDLIYLEESSITIEGLNIYGTPYSPFFYNWAFPTFPDHEREKGGITASRWNKIPENTDIVLVHGPPLNILDKTTSDEHTGCPFLAEKIAQVEPLLCIFGHIHEAYGCKQIENIIYANVSTLNFNYNVQNKPMLFDLIPFIDE